MIKAVETIKLLELLIERNDSFAKTYGLYASGTVKVSIEIVLLIINYQKNINLKID